MSKPMTVLADVAATAAVADVQGRADPRRIAIDKVGVRGLRHPLRVRDRTGQVQNVVASIDMYVDLPHQYKGTHMSRFVELLNDPREVLGVDTFGALLRDMTHRLGADRGFVEARFAWFVDKRAPVSGVRSLLDYEAALRGEIRGGDAELTVRVVVPVTSLCPCSKEIADYGAHNQRSHVTVSAVSAGDLWIEDLIDVVESEASCELYGLLKRPDEKFVTERAYDNPKFVEDMVRDVAARLNDDPRVLAYVVESENFESIHNHSAYALIERDKRDTGRDPR